MKKIGLFVKRDSRAIQTADRLQLWLKERNITVVRKESLPPGRQRIDEPENLAPSDLFCVFVLGGDGTFLGGVRWIGDQDIPILGAKFGAMGFLADTTEENLLSAVSYILDNGLVTTPRIRLEVRVLRGNGERFRQTVLNDVVINKGALARLAHIQTQVDDHYLTTYRADGLIVSTPTGSTAYSLAAGGPIIHPEVPAIILTPICPFTLTNRPLIIPDTSVIKMRLDEKDSEIVLTFDGQSGLQITPDDTISVRKSPHPIRIISLPKQQYFDVLKAKLRWSGGRT